ncbi:MAG: hypothetical protein IT427_17105 [Pirellulales bacterium]|nr:hypothetical protein [Pirellulales bacterium]
MSLHRWIHSVFALVLAVAIIRPARAISVDPPVQVGTMTSLTLNEVSGVVASRALADTLWVHNDSGDTARFFAIGTGGNLLGEYSLSGATATDWEDMAIGPKPGGGNYLYLADIGDNSGARAEITIYRATEPLSAAGGSIAAAEYSTLQLQYPGPPRNAESFLVDPITGDLFIISKGLTASVFRAPAGAFDATQPVALALLGNLGSAISFSTAADISPDGASILVRGYGTTARLFQRSPGQSVGDALLAPGVAVTLAAETQGEAIGWAADGKGFYTTSEFAGLASQPIYYYGVTVAEPAAAMLGGAGVIVLLIFRRRRFACSVDLDWKV